MKQNSIACDYVACFVGVHDLNGVHMSLNSPGYNQVRTLNSQMVRLNHIKYTSIYHDLFHFNSIIGVIRISVLKSVFRFVLNSLELFQQDLKKSTFQMTFRKVTSLCSRKYKNKSNYSALPLTIKIYSFFILCKRIKVVISLFNMMTRVFMNISSCK